MSRRCVSTTLFIVLLLVALVAMAGCTMPKTQPTAVPTAVGPKSAGTGTVPAATGMPTTVATKAVVVVASPTGAAPTSPVATSTTQPAPLPTTVPQPTAVPVAPGSPTTYVVQPGDWLWKIARAKNVSPQAIAAANPGINVNLLQPGQQLIIPAPGSTPAATPVPGGTGQVTHVVKSGENLFRIALKYGKTTQAVATANGITNPNLIYVGQVLVIP